MTVKVAKPSILLALVSPLDRRHVPREVRPDVRELARIREVLGDAVELHGERT